MRKLILLLAALVSSSIARAETIEMKVYGLVCAFCAQGIEKTLRKNPATADVYVSLEDKVVAVALRDGQDIADDELRKEITDAGFAVKAIDRTTSSLAEIRERTAGKTK
jgi:copper chaperone CopZ